MKVRFESNWFFILLLFSQHINLSFVNSIHLGYNLCFFNQSINLLAVMLGCRFADKCDVWGTVPEAEFANHALHAADVRRRVGHCDDPAPHRDAAPRQGPHIHLQLWLQRLPHGPRVPARNGQTRVPGSLGAYIYTTRCLMCRREKSGKILMADDENLWPSLCFLFVCRAQSLSVVLTVLAFLLFIKFKVSSGSTCLIICCELHYLYVS